MNGNSDDALARLHKARAVTGAAEARKLYADWARTYDEDVFNHVGVTGTGRVAELLISHAGSRSGMNILDAGCGTGALGALLQGAGFRHIDGIDISPEMLAVAARKQVYRTLAEADLNQPFEAPLSSYDAVVSAGTFVHGHVGGRGFAGLARLVDRNGMIVCAISDQVWGQDRFDRLVPELELEPISHSLEAVLPGGAADVHMLVARRI